MTTAALIAAVVVGVFLALMFGALVELYRQVDQLRQQAGLVDQTTPVSFDESVTLPELGLPLTDSTRPEERFAILFLSVSCTTCADVARGLPLKRSPNLATVVEAETEEIALGWLDKVHLRADQRVLFDAGSRLATTLGISTTPSAVKFVGTRAVSASTVPSKRQLHEVLDWVNGQGGADITVPIWNTKGMEAHD